MLHFFFGIRGKISTVAVFRNDRSRLFGGAKRRFRDGTAAVVPVSTGFVAIGFLLFGFLFSFLGLLRMLVGQRIVAVAVAAVATTTQTRGGCCGGTIAGTHG